MSDLSHPEPVQKNIVANGIAHNVLLWPVSRAKGLVVLAHGYLDCAWSFAFVARELNALGFSCAAFDFRGHGQSQWTPIGSYYHFADYVLDLHELLPQIAAEFDSEAKQGQYHLVGHSMGGTACSLFASTQPSAMQTLSLLEGVGPEDTDAKVAAKRLQLFIETVAKVRSRIPKPLTLEAAATRMRMTHGELTAEMSQWLATKCTREVQGGVLFAFDPMHQSTSPIGFRADVFGEALARITQPVLVVTGSRGYAPWDQPARVARIPHAQSHTLEGASHMMHWFGPAEVAKLIATHIERATPA